MNRIREERIRRGWSQWELSKKLNVHPVVVSNIERGVLKPWRKLRKKLCRVFRLSEEELFGEEK